MGIQRSTSDVVIKSDAEMLALWKQVECDIAETGVSYDAGGGIRYTMASLSDVRKQINYYERRILAAKGYRGINTADIENGND